MPIDALRPALFAEVGPQADPSALWTEVMIAG